MSRASVYCCRQRKEQRDKRQRAAVLIIEQINNIPVESGLSDSDWVEKRPSPVGEGEEGLFAIRNILSETILGRYYGDIKYRTNGTVLIYALHVHAHSYFAFIYIYIYIYKL